MKNLYNILLFMTLVFSAGAGFAQDDGDLQKAIEMHRQGANSQAIAALEKLAKIKNFKDAATVQNYLGLAYLEKNDLKKGRKALEKAVRLNPQNAVFRANLAYAFLRANKLDNAQTEAEKAIRIDPNLYAAYYVRGTANLLERKFDDAAADADRAIAVSADFSPAYTLKSETLVAQFGNRTGSGSTPKNEVGLLARAIEVLEACIKNCRENKDLAIQTEKLESLKVFHDFFEKEETPPDPLPLVPEDDPNRLKIISKPRAGYTEAARSAGITGRIVVAVLFAANGQVTQTIVIKPLGYGLDQEAVRAARGIRFTPAVKDGKPVSVVKMVEYSFMIY